MPRQFSWLDRRLVRNGYFRNCSAEALKLYLFLICVADRDGLSFYSDRAICEMLNFEKSQLKAAKFCLIEADLVLFERSVCQVLELTDGSCPEIKIPVLDVKRQVEVAASTVEKPATSEQVQAIFDSFLGRCNHD